MTLASSLNFAGPDFLVLFILLLILLSFVFWIRMLIDCAKYETGTEQVVWILIIIFTHSLGAMIYYFCRKAPRGN